ncbi:MAG: Cross-beta structure silk protein 1, partial [Parcubacteria group bacterium GW2011_GWE2_38_18]
MLKLYYYLQSKIQTTELSLSQKIEKKLNEPYNSNLFYFNVIFLNIALVFWQVAVDAAKLLIILTRDPGVSFNIFFKQRELRSCPFSYHYFKSIQQRVRIFSLAGVTAMVIVTVITSLITNLIFGGTPPGRAATYTYSQGWSSYASSSNLSVAANLLSLNLLSGSFIQTNNGTTTTGFNLPGGSFVNSILNGTGDTSIRLAISTQGLSFTQTDDTANTSGPSTLSGGFNNSGNVKSNTEIVGTGDNALVKLSASPSNQIIKTWGVGGTDGNTAPGTYSWTVPDGVTSFTATIAGSGGSGGSQGGYWEGWVEDGGYTDYGCDGIWAGDNGGFSSVSNGTKIATAGGGAGGPPGTGGAISSQNVSVISSDASGGSAGGSYVGSGDTYDGCSVDNSYAVNGGNGGKIVATFNSVSGTFTIIVGSGAGYENYNDGDNGSVSIAYSSNVLYNNSGSYTSYVDGGASPTVWDTFRFNRSLTAGGSGAATANFKVRSG